jgi:hypothetical protein
MIFVQPTNYQEALRIIIQSVHPHEVLYQDEAAILYGLSPRTISSRQNTGELYVKVNVGK